MWQSMHFQHFTSIAGFCGWNSHETPLVPYTVDVEMSPRRCGKDAVRAARIAGLYASALNGVATEMHLPFGGYGLTAACNDSAAIVQQCLYGKSLIYPITSIGRFMQRTIRYIKRLRTSFIQIGNNTMSEEIHDLNVIARAHKEIPTDINAAPSNAESAAWRLLKTLPPKLPFLLMEDSKRVMENILDEEAADSSVEVIPG